MTAAAASPVYELLGAHELSSPTFSVLETGLMSGEPGFRQHGEGHTDRPNWPVFLEYAAGYWH